jgi:hypothetical protein
LRRVRAPIPRRLGREARASVGLVLTDIPRRQCLATPRFGRFGVRSAVRRVIRAPDWHLLVALDMLVNDLTTGLVLSTRGSAARTVVVWTALGNLLLLWVIAMLPQRELAAGKVLNRDGRP